MSSVTAHSIVGREIYDLLNRLGKMNWLRFKLREPDSHITDFNLDLNINQFPYHEQAFLEYVKSDPFLLYSLYGKAIWVANGPKILRPDKEQCNALRHVDINVQFSEYEQPFPAVLIEFPESFREDLQLELEVEVPKYVLLCHRSENKYIIAMEIEVAGGEERAAILPPKASWQNIQDGLNHFSMEATGPRGERLLVLTSIAINFALLLTQYGTVNLGPINPKAYAKQQQNAKRKSGKRAERAKRLLEGTIERIDFAQHVVLQRKYRHPGHRYSQGSTKKPHWRRGHYRQQLIGTGRSKSKRLFIKPMFIGADSFDGDLADTSYSIQVRG